MSKDSSFLLANALGPEETSALEKSIAEALEKRFNTHPSYSRNEVEEVGRRPHRLFPPGFALRQDDWLHLNSLVSTYRSGLKPPHVISSHRPLLGPIIVAVKKVVWRVLHFFLNGAFEQQEDFHRHVIRAYSRQILENAELRSRLAKRGEANGRPDSERSIG